MAEGRFVIPVLAEHAADAGGQAEGLLHGVDHAVLQPAHFLQGELALPVFDLLGGLVVEITLLVAVRHHQRPAARRAEQRDLVAAGLDVGEPFAAVAEHVAQRGEGVHALALADHGAVRHRAIAAAVVAVVAPVGVLHGAVVEAGQRVAGFLARVDVVVPPVGDQEVARRVAVTRRVGGVVAGILLRALEAPQRVLVAVLHPEHRVERAAREAAGQVQHVRFAAAVLGPAVAVVDGGAVGLLLEDEVDHAGNRVRAVDRRGAAGQHFDAVDHPQRDAGDVGEVAAPAERHREVGDAAAVDQHQGVVGAEAAQVHLLRAGGEVGAARGLLALGFATVLGQRLQHVGHAGEAGGADVLGGDQGDRRRAFDLRARDARTGDLHGFHVGDRGVGRGLRLGGTRPRRGGGRGLRRRRLRHDQHRAGVVALGMEAAALEQGVERLRRRRLALEAGAARALELVGAVHQLGAGLACIGIQRSGEVAGGNVDAPTLRLRGECGGTGQGQEQDAQRTGRFHAVSPRRSMRRRYDSMTNESGKSPRGRAGLMANAGRCLPHRIRRAPGSRVPAGARSLPCCPSGNCRRPAARPPCRRRPPVCARCSG